MAHEKSRNDSIWPLITIIAVVIALGAVGWDVMLHRHNQVLEDRLRKIEARVDGIDGKGKGSEAVAAAARKKARAEKAATETGGVATPAGDKPTGTAK
jgi:hypothetical protein